MLRDRTVRLSRKMLDNDNCDTDSLLRLSILYCISRRGHYAACTY